MAGLRGAQHVGSLEGLRLRLEMLLRGQRLARDVSLAGGIETKLLLSEVLGSALLKPVIAPCSEQNGQETKSNFQPGSTEG